MSYERLGLLSDVEPVLHKHGYSTGDCAVLFAIADKESTNLTKEIDVGTLDAYSKEGLDAWCWASAGYIAWKKGLGERSVRETLKKAELDGLIDVRRRTRVRGGVEKRSFNGTDWRRINLPAFQALERELPTVALELDEFVHQHGKKPTISRLDFAPFLRPEDIPLGDKEWGDSYVEGLRSADGAKESSYPNKYARDTSLVYIRSLLNAEGWILQPYMDVGSTGIVPCIHLEYVGQSNASERVEDGREEQFREFSPRSMKHVDTNLSRILHSNNDCKLPCKSVFERDASLDYLVYKLGTSDWSCTKIVIKYMELGDLPAVLVHRKSMATSNPAKDEFPITQAETVESSVLVEYDERDEFEDMTA